MRRIVLAATAAILLLVSQFVAAFAQIPGSVVAWGRDEFHGNEYGQCNVPAPNADFVVIAASGTHSLGLKSDGRIVAWGSNGNGQCNVPPPNAEFVAMDGGVAHSLGLKRDGSVVCWGWNNHGQLNVPAPNADFMALAGGPGHSLGVRRSVATPVDLSALEATATPRGVVVTWSTSFENDHLGFRVHRAARADGEYAQLTGLIEPPGPYRFLDTDVRRGATYFYRLEAVDRSGGSEFNGPIEATAAAGVGSPRFMLSQNQPNPLVAERGGTLIGFTLGEPAQAKLRIFDASGRLVRLLVDRPLDAGPHTALWDGRNDGGNEAASGIYYYRLDAGEYTQVKTLVKVR